MPTLIVQQNGQFCHDVDPSAISDMLTEPDDILWLDICNPTEQDIALLRDEFRFHPLSIEDAVRSHERPKVETYDHYYLIIFYAANYHHSTEQIDLQALSLFIGANYLVTVHQKEIAAIEETLRRWQSPHSPLSNRVAVLIHALLDSLVDNYFPVMDNIAERVEDLEDTIFERFDSGVIEPIFRLKKDLFSLRRVISPERDVLNVLLRRELPIFSERDTAYLQDVYDHIVRVTDTIDAYRDLLASAMDSYLSLQSNNLNQIVKVLTLASIVLMSDALIAGIYGMNFAFMPELHWSYGYPFALLLMVVISAVLILFFRSKKWL